MVAFRPCALKCAHAAHFPTGVLGLIVCGCIGILSVWQTFRKSQQLQDDQLPLYERALKTKWLHYKTLELATRSVERHDIFFSVYASSMSDMSTELDWMIDKVEQIHKDDWKSLLAEVRAMNIDRISDDQRAIDGEDCAQWGTFDCSVAVPGVASNVDVTVTISDGISGCDAVDAVGGGICEWMPDRPDEVPEPQPPNLLNKCVCYACKGPLPDRSPDSSFVFPEEYDSSLRGTDARYQCLNDPRYSAKCTWDGLNCVPVSALPDQAILNSSDYMARFDSISGQLGQVEVSIDDDIRDTIKWLIGFSRVSIIATGCVASFYTLLLFFYVLWQKRPGQRYSLGLAFYTMTGLFLLMGWAFLVFVVFTSTHMEELWTTMRDTELVMHRTAWNIIFYDAILTTSASRFVMTAHNSGWVDEEYTGVPGGVRVYDHWFINYIETVGSLDAAINYAIEHAVSAEEQQIFTTIGTVNKILVDLEQIALCSCEPPDASALPANDTTVGVSSMYSTTYLQAKETYNQQNENFLRVQMQRLLVKVRELQSKAELMLIMMATMMIFIPLSLIEISRQILARKAQRQLEYEQRKQRIDNVLSNTVDLLAHPLITMRCSVFLRMGGMLRHEVAREKGLLKYCDSSREARSLFIVFISHQWLHSSEPDPCGVQYDAIGKAMGELQVIHSVSENDIYIWLDYHSIPQFNPVSVGIGVSAIASLVNYAMCSSVMCIIAPTATHENGHICNFNSYMSRGWCRAEQAGYMLKNGNRNLYIQDEGGFKAASTVAETMDNYEAFFPMEGTFSCCQWKHSFRSSCDREQLVDVMLYLYYSATLLADVEDSRHVYNFVMANKARIFPQTFLKTTKTGVTSQELFGQLLHELDKMLKRGELQAHHKRHAVGADSPVSSKDVGQECRPETDEVKWAEDV